jgi:signal transduction histidine kinase
MTRSEPVPDRTRSAELAALTAIAAQVNCTQDLDEILQGALQTTLEVVGADAGEVFLVDEDTGDLTLHSHLGISDAFVAEEATIGPGECVCGHAVATDQALAAPELASHPARSRPTCLREGFRSVLCLPLRAHGQVLGLLNVQSRRAHHFAASDEELLTAIGNQIGIAIANAQLIDDAEQRRATLSSVMLSLVDGLILFDRRGRITFVNAQAEELLEVPRQMLLQRSIAAIDGQIASQLADTNAPDTRLETASQDPGAVGLELDLAGRTRRSLLARFFAIHDAGGGSLGLGLLLRDVTREKELDEMKSQLLSTVSHELRTPLASIKGFATTLLRDDVQWDDETRREFLFIIDEESDRLSELIDNLLEMSRIEAGTLRVEPEPLDVRHIVAETVAQFEVIARKHRFAAHLPTQLPLVMADPRRIRQVLRNLVENAVKYSPEGGAVTISAETTEDGLQVTVADEGIGISPKHLEHVFDRFYQVDSASTRIVGGSGLGLSICTAILEAHRGKIWAESQPGKGSQFYFSLPLA